MENSEFFKNQYKIFRLIISHVTDDVLVVTKDTYVHYESLEGGVRDMKFMYLKEHPNTIKADMFISNDQTHGSVYFDNEEMEYGSLHSVDDEMHDIDLSTTDGRDSFLQYFPPTTRNLI